MRRLIQASAFGLLLTLLAEPSLACSVCVGAQTPDTRNAWIAMTAFMTFTPLSIVLGVIFWVRHQYKALEADDLEAVLPDRGERNLRMGRRSS